jgi:hypothetical protein
MGMALLTKLAEGRQDAQSLGNPSAASAEANAQPTSQTEGPVKQGAGRESGNVLTAEHADRTRAVWLRLDPEAADQELPVMGADVGAPREAPRGDGDKEDRG